MQLSYLFKLKMSYILLPSGSDFSGNLENAQLIFYCPMYDKNISISKIQTSIFPSQTCFQPGVGKLTLVPCQVLTKAALSVPSTTGQGRENISKGSWAGIKAQRDHSPVTIKGKTESSCGNDFITNQIRVA